MSKEYPKARHVNCQNCKCRICLEDGCDSLGGFLDKETGNDKIDHLGRYHKFLSDNNINPETEYGWWTEAVFKKENLDAYIKYFKEA